MSVATSQIPVVDHEKLMSFVFKIVDEMGAAATAPLVVLGDQLGLYKAIVETGPITPESLAARTGTHVRYVREWLSNQAAAGYVEYNLDSGRFSMTPEQAMVLADEESPVYVMGAFYSFMSLFADQPRLVEAFKTGDGISWGNHHSCLFTGVAKFFKPSYRAHLVQDWLPAIDGATGKLEAGAKVADVGCGHGTSTILLAKAFPNSQFYGFDFHEASIDQARAAAAEEGLTNITFEVVTAQEFPGKDYDLVLFFDCLHDMGDPVGAALQVKRALAPKGVCMIVEPAAQDSLSGNLNPVGRLYYAYSTQVCTPSALSQDGRLSLGAQAGEARMTEVLRAGGFTKVRRAAETPFNMVLEARP